MSRTWHRVRRVRAGRQDRWSENGTKRRRHRRRWPQIEKRRARKAWRQASRSDVARRLAEVDR